MKEETTPAPVPTTHKAMAKKYTFKNGSDAMKHPIIGSITKDHLAGEKREKFIKAIKNCDQLGTTKGWYEKFIQEA